VWIFGLKGTLHRLLDTPGARADQFEATMGSTPGVTHDGEEQVRREHLHSPAGLGKPIRALHRSFERARRFQVHHAKRAQEIALPHPELG
jgi:hypothetical protein